MTNSNLKCVFCGTSTAERPAAESAQVRCNVREFGAETFTVWRCAQCGSLHALEPIDADHYYRHYPLKHQRYDFGTKAVLRKRLGVLKRAGLKRGTTLLDYGCGSGHFVRYAREHGVHAEGYDPYSDEFADASVLYRAYDFVTAQDVLEHDDDPRALVDDLKGYVVPAGCLAIRTPNAEAIDFHDPLDHIAYLHQPYHRHIPSAVQLQRMASEGGWRVVEFRKDLSDTRVPFVNEAFGLQYLKTTGGYLDGFYDPVGPLHFLAHPSLIFWALFGSFIGRKKEVIIVARARPRSMLTL